MIAGNVGDDVERACFPLTGQLLSGIEALEWIRAHIRLRVGPVAMCSAYIRSSALRSVLESVRENLTGDVLVRWKPGDLANGASDFDAYFVAKERGLRFFMRTDFHGKVYSIPGAGNYCGKCECNGKWIFLGGVGGNSEVCTLVNDSASNRVVINGLLDSATEVDDELVNELRAWIEGQLPNQSFGEWPENIAQKLARLTAPSGLLVDECFLSSGSVFDIGKMATTDDERHDFRLLGMPYDVRLNEQVHAELRRALEGARIVRWLRAALRERGGEAYFGSLTECLHTSLLDDPAPRRFEVKRLLQNLLGWILSAGLREFQMDRPNYSQRVTLTGRTSR